MTKIAGNYVEDTLEGPGTIYYTNGDRLTCEFIHSIPNGPGKLFDKENNIKQVRKPLNKVLIVFRREKFRKKAINQMNIILFEKFTEEVYADI